MFSNHVHKIIILPTLVIRIPSLEILLFCQHNSTGGGNLELRQTIRVLKKKTKNWHLCVRFTYINTLFGSL
jgi:hypothetical protein